MKEYIFDDSTVEYIDGVKTKLISSIIHYEPADLKDPNQTEIWTKDRVIAELVIGNGIDGIPGIDIVKKRIFPDGKTEIVQKFELDITSAYALFMHLKHIDEVNSDKLYW